MKHLGTLIVGAATFASAMAAQPDQDEWRLMIRDDLGTEYYIRERDLSNQSDFRPTVWVQQDHSKDRSISYRTTKERYEFDCRGARFRTLYAVTYDAKGAVLSSGAVRSPYFDPLVPDAVISLIAEAVCPKKVDP